MIWIHLNLFSGINYFKKDICNPILMINTLFELIIRLICILIGGVELIRVVVNILYVQNNENIFNNILHHLFHTFFRLKNVL